MDKKFPESRKLSNLCTQNPWISASLILQNQEGLVALTRFCLTYLQWLKYLLFNLTNHFTNKTLNHIINTVQAFQTIWHLKLNLCITLTLHFHFLHPPQLHSTWICMYLQIYLMHNICFFQFKILVTWYILGINISKYRPWHKSPWHLRL